MTPTPDERADAVIRLLALPDDTPDLRKRGHVWTQHGVPRRQRRLRVRLPLISATLRRQARGESA